jgi:hypothetical protein
MELNKGDLIRVSFNHREGGIESRAGIVTEPEPLLGDAQTVQFTPAELQSGPVRLYEVVLGEQVTNKFRASVHTARKDLKLMRNGEYNAEVNWLPGLRRLSDKQDPGIIVKAISGGDVQFYPEILNRVNV